MSHLSILEIFLSLPFFEFQTLIFRLLLVWPRNFERLGVIHIEGSKAKIVGDLIRGTKGTVWYPSRLGQERPCRSTDFDLNILPPIVFLKVKYSHLCQISMSKVA